ncbi:MAG: hypothetical protein OXC61_10175, partial [Flavobacteriaceae bacterium]|nr:hypothetical protein [Flavobacteriaceae bacterium]
NANDNKNNLIAKEITQEILKANKSVDRAGKIVDETGLSDLEDVLKHADTKRAVISFDGTDAFKGQNKTAEAVELKTTEANHEHLILFRKGTANIEGKKGKAKRVFLVDTGAISDLSSSEDLRIGVNDNDGDLTDFYVPIDLIAGGSVNNHVVTINDEEIKKSFDTNNVEVNAEAGGHPKGSLTFKTDGTLARVAGNNDLTDDPVGSLKLTIGNTRTGVYSHEVILQVVDDDNPLKADVAFSATEKKAKTFLNANVNSNSSLDDISDNSSRGYASLEELANILIRPFPTFVNDNDLAENDPPRPTDAVNHVPFGISSLQAVSIEGTERVNTAIVGVYDAQKISENQINVKVENKIKLTSAPNAENVAFFKAGGGFGDAVGLTHKNIKNDPNTIQITLTSKVAGLKESTIGVPTDDLGGTDSALATDYILPDSDIATTPGAYVYAGTATGPISRELPIAETNPRASSLPKAGADDVGAQTRGGKEFNRLEWL